MHINFAHLERWLSSNNALIYGVFLTSSLLGLYLTSRVNYLLFHSLAELFSIVIASCIFLIAWNSRQYIENSYLLCIGIAYLFIACLDLLHTLAYKGMPIFPDYDYYANQLWIGARYLESITLAGAFYFLIRKRTIQPNLTFITYAVVCATLIMSIFWWKVFPECFIEGQGLTPFKKISEYIICLILASAGALLYKNRDQFEQTIFYLLLTSLGCTIVSELAFTIYISNYGISNLVGHYFKIFSFFFVYKAIIETGIQTPFSIIFRDLEKSNQNLIEEIEIRKKTERELQESHDLLANLACLVPGVVYQYRLYPDGRSAFPYASPGMNDIYEVTPKEVQEDATPVYGRLHPDDFDKVSNSIQESARTLRTFFCEFRVNLPKQGLRWRWSQAQPERMQDGGTLWHGIISDITERKQAEQEQAKLEAMNRQLQKAESLGVMAGAIAHRFNNQLAVVMGNLEMALEDLPQDAAPVPSLTAAIQGARNAAEVSGQMLTYLGQTTGMHAPLDLSKTCRQSLPLIQAVIPKGQMIKIDLPSAGPTISSNANQMQQLLTNLVTNAWEANGAKQGTVNLIVKMVFPEEISAIHRFPIEWQPRDLTYACLEIMDIGCGIADEIIDKIFDPFFSTKFTGRGLGLPVVLGIVKVHDGAITVESEVGRGSSFQVFLPMPAEQTFPKSDTTAQALEIEEGGTVLLVEDEEILRNMAETMLMRLGLKVFTAKDGIEAVEVFKKHLNEIHIVVSDLSMPHMDGWETLSALRRIRSDIPVIFVSGHDESKVITDDHTELPQVILHKPFQKAALKEALARAMKKA